MDERSTIGERLIQRLDSRSGGGVRASSTQAFDDRYSRFARTRGMSRLGLSLFPDETDTRHASSASFGERAEPSFVSGVPFWARMRRIGAARLRRQEWLAGLGEKLGHRSLKTRSTPRLGSLSSLFGPESLSPDFQVLLQPEVAAEDSETEADGRPKSRWGNVESPGGSAWHVGSAFVPAPRIKGMRGNRPVAQAEARAPEPVVIERVVQQVIRAAQAGKAEVVLEEVPASIAAKVRRAVRRQARSLGVAPAEIAAAMPDAFAAPSTVAAGRGPSRRSKKARGLRAVNSSSPMMKELSVSSEPESPDLGASVLSRTAHRDRSPRTGEQLSASPVGRPSRRARIAARRDASVEVDFGQASDAALSLDGRAALGQAAGSAARADSADRVDASGSERRVSASERSGGSRRARASYVSEPTVLQPEGSQDVSMDGDDRLPIGSDTPSQWRGAPVVRSTARVAQRARAAVVGAQGGHVSGLADPQEQTELGRAAGKRTRRASLVGRTSDGTFVSSEAPSVLDPAAPPSLSRAPAAGERSRRVSAGERPGRRAVSEAVGGRVVEARQSPVGPSAVGASYAAERLNQAEESGRNVPRRSVLPRVTPGRAIVDGFVLPLPEDVAAEATDDSTAAPLSGGLVNPGAAKGGWAASPGSRSGSPRSRSGSPRSRSGSPGSRAEAPRSPTSQAAQRARKAPVVGLSAARFARPTELSGGPESKKPGLTARPRRSGAVDYASAARPETVTITVPLPAAGAVLDAGLPQETRSTAEEGRAPGLTEVSKARAIRTARATPEGARPLDWSHARVELGQPRRMPSPGTRAARARARTDAAGTYVPARQGRSPSRRSTVQTADTMVLPEQYDETGLGPAAESEGTPRQARSVGFDHTVQGVGTGRVDSEMPIWAQRATGAPRIRGSEELVDALARAAKPDEVVEVLMQRSAKMSTATSVLPTPVIQVIQQIQAEAGKVAGELHDAAVDSGRSRPGQRGQVRSSARVIRGMTGLRPSSGASSSSGGVQKVSALARRLQQLIEMAEMNRDTARREVRMAEDSSAARSEGSAAPAAEGATQDSSVDVDALAQEVTDAVTRELEMRQERRLDDPTGRSIWWE